MNSKLIKTAKNFSPYIIWCISYLSTITFFLIYGKTYLDADMASEMVLANLLNKEGGLVSTNWFYSSELRIIEQQAFFKLFLLLFPHNWHIARTLTQALLLLLTSFSYVYMTSILMNKKRSILFSSILLCPFGFWYMFHGTFGGFYLIHIISFMLCAGLLFRICLRPEHSLHRWLILGLLSMTLGLQSVRFLMNLAFPLLLASCFVFYSKAKQNITSLKVDCYPEFKFFCGSLFMCILSGIGYIINSKYLSTLFSYSDTNEQWWSTFSIIRIIEPLNSFLGLFGYPIPDYFSIQVPLISKCGILSGFSILFISLVIFNLCQVFRKCNDISTPQRLITYSCISCIAIQCLVFGLFPSNCNGSYFIPTVPFVIATIQIGIDTYSYRLRNGKTLITGSLFLIVFICSITTSSLFLKNPPRANTGAVAMTESLLDQKFEQGIASFWNSNTITELSNGEIEMWTANNLFPINIDQWLQNMEHVNNLPVGKCFIILADTERDNYMNTLLSFPDTSIVYEDNHYTVIGFEHIEDYY